MQKPSFDRSALIHGVLEGDVRSTSRLLSLIARRQPEARGILKVLYPHTGKARLLGVTGPAGVGKSTLIDRLITGFREKEQSVGVLAIDPSSPFTGGSILGDRIRMYRHFLDPGVFIRSMAMAAAWGGLSPALFDAIHVLDAMGKEMIIIETLGAGQDEVQIARLAETLLLVLAPGMGDEVQALKAGLLEIGDVIAVNKGDLNSAAGLVQMLQMLGPERKGLRVSAETGEGMVSLISALRKTIKANAANRIKKRQFVREELRVFLREKIFGAEDQVVFSEKTLEAILKRKEDPYSHIESCS